MPAKHGPPAGLEGGPADIASLVHDGLSARGSCVDQFHLLMESVRGVEEGRFDFDR
jgi:hypothetical protein